MADLADVISSPSGARLRQGQVAAVAGTGGKYLHIDYAAGRVLNAGKFDSDTYSVGDYVWFLLDNEAGALVLGKQTPGTHDTSVITPPAAITVTAASYGTYDLVAGMWTASVLNQSPTTVGAWFYAAGAFSAMAGVPLGAVEVEVTRTTGGPVEFTTHQNMSGAGTFLGTDDWFGAASPEVGVATWTPVPLDWGTQLASGAIKGIAIGGGLYTGTYSGTGRVRLTPTG